MSGIDQYTKLMLHCNGTDGSTVFTDDSDFVHTVTANGNAQLDTAEKKFGTASGLFSAFTDYLSIPDSADWDLESEDFTIDCWVRINNSSPETTICGRVTSSGSYFYLSWEGGSLRFRDYPGSIDFSRTITETTGTWFHLAVVRNGNDFMMFKDGVQQGTTYTNSASFLDRSVPLEIGRMSQNGSYYLDGHIDEFRWSKGIARWTSNFTPPTEEYSGDEILNIEETITLDDNWQIQTNPEQQNIVETVTLDDNWIIQSNPEQEQIEETITLNDEWNISTIEYSNFASKIISYNPLIYVTNSSPAKIIKVDISDPENPVRYTYEIISNSYAKDVIFNASNDYFYISCSNGKIVKINKDDLEDQTIIDTLDTNNLLNIDLIDSSFLTFSSTDDSTGEIIMLDEREVKKINVDIRWSIQIQSIISIYLNTILGKIVNLDLRWASYVSKTINLDLRWLKSNYTDIFKYPISSSDWTVYINGIELTVLDDVDMNSVLITHDITQEEIKASQAQFILNRRHDKLNYTNTGVSSIITNNNEVIIKIKGNTEFTGKISNLTCNSETETVNVIAIGTRPSDKRHTVNIPMSELNESLHLYHCLVNNINVDNPYIQSSDENPEYYKGIQVDLGTYIRQDGIRYTFVTPILDQEEFKDNIIDGDFKPEEGWTYFWFVRCRNFLSGAYNGTKQYIGTSLNNLYTDAWEVIDINYYRQIDKDDIETDLGIYQIGEAPYQEISVKNGKKISKWRWVDKFDGLYNIKDEGYDYTEYAKQVADLEYEKLLNINGEILPKTSAEILLSIDAYYYYNIGLLTRLNITNTTTSNIYKNQNGFPVSVKNIRIQCNTEGENSMIVSLTCDNAKSQLELEEIDAQYPDENSEEFVFEEDSYREKKKIYLDSLGKSSKDSIINRETSLGIGDGWGFFENLDIGGWRYNE